MLDGSETVSKRGNRQRSVLNVASHVRCRVDHAKCVSATRETVCGARKKKGVRLAGQTS